MCLLLKEKKMSASSSYYPSPESPWPPAPIIDQLRHDNTELKRFYTNYTALIIRIIQFTQHPHCFEWIHLHDIKRFRADCRRYIHDHIFIGKNLNEVTCECYERAITTMRITSERMEELRPLNGWNFLRLDK